MSMKIDGGYDHYQSYDAGWRSAQPEKRAGQPKLSEPSGKETAAVKEREDGSERPAEKCTVNTDKVDREIEMARKKVQQLEQQVKSAAGDEKKVKELALAQAKSELGQKDNDAYRRQHASVSVSA